MLQPMHDRKPLGHSRQTSSGCRKRWHGCSTHSWYRNIWYQRELADIHVQAALCWSLVPAAPKNMQPCAGSPALVQAGSAGQLGAPLLEADRKLLQLKPLRPFAKGEMCAVDAAQLDGAATGACHGCAAPNLV